MERISESGVITVSGQLRMPMDRLNAFFQKHKGERVVVKFEAAAPGNGPEEASINALIITISFRPSLTPYTGRERE